MGQSCGKASWESLFGKPRGKATDPLIPATGSVTLLLQLVRKAHVQDRKSTRLNSSLKPHSQSPLDVSVHSRETCFPCTASTFNPRIHSHHGDTWDSPVGKPHGKASRERHRSLDPREGKRDTAATAREESARACPHSRRGLTPLGRLQKYPKIHVSTGEESSGSGTDCKQGLSPQHRRERKPKRPPRSPRATPKGTGLS